MKTLRLFSLLLVVATTAAGCMQTRHVEAKSVMNCTVGDGASASSDSTYSERRWSGLAVGQPARIQP